MSAPSLNPPLRKRHVAEWQHGWLLSLVSCLLSWMESYFLSRSCRILELLEMSVSHLGPVLGVKQPGGARAAGRDYQCSLCNQTSNSQPAQALRTKIGPSLSITVLKNSFKNDVFVSIMPISVIQPPFPAILPAEKVTEAIWGMLKEPLFEAELTYREVLQHPSCPLDSPVGLWTVTVTQELDFRLWWFRLVCESNELQRLTKPPKPSSELFRVEQHGWWLIVAVRKLWCILDKCVQLFRSEVVFSSRKSDWRHYLLLFVQSTPHWWCSKPWAFCFMS